MVGNVIQIKSTMKVCVGVSEKIKPNVMCVKKIMFGILVHVLARLINI